MTSALAAPTSRRPIIALAAAVLFGAIALVVVPVAHHAWLRHESAAGRRDLARAEVAAQGVTLPTSFTPTTLLGFTPCPTPGVSAAPGRCWLTKVAPHQAATALLAAAKTAGLPATSRGCEGGPTKRTGVLAHFARTESCVVVANYGQYDVRLAASTNLVVTKTTTPGPTATSSSGITVEGSTVTLLVQPH